MTDSHIMRPADLLEYWQGHRRLTRRVIEAFPDDQLFTLHARAAGLLETMK